MLTVDWNGLLKTRERKAKKKPDSRFDFSGCILYRHLSALNEARFPIFTVDQKRCRGRGPGRAAVCTWVCRADEKQIALN